MREASYKVPGGKLIKVKLWISSGKISDIKILGDFFLHPEETLKEIEDSLIGFPGERSSIEEAIAKTLTNATLIGATAEDFTKTIMLAWGSE